jgi:hypothetical protein
MSGDDRRTALTAAEAQELCRLLAAEERAYGRLYRLARRQNRYLRRHDLARLESNAGEWGKYLPHATRAREERERCVASYAARVGLDAPPPTPLALLDYADLAVKTEVRERVRGLLEITTRLARQNELNRNLTCYCLDLVQEEADIFREAVLNDPAGRYGEDARKTTAGPGGVLVRQA